MVKYRIVVARYTEDIKWISDPNSLIYNKGPPLHTDLPVVNLPNVGRESDTYLTHIIENYDNLDEYIVFLQGNPFDHSPNLMRDLTCLIKRIESGETLIYENLSNAFLDCNISGCQHHPNLPLLSCYNRLFGSSIKEKSFKFSAGAQFLVSREAIHRHPLIFYNRAKEMVDYTINPIEGFVLERFWCMFFTS
jgi:hypothetical protein